MTIKITRQYNPKFLKTQDRLVEIVSDDIKYDPDGYKYYFAEIDGETVGVIQYSILPNLELLWVDILFVAEQHRLKGVGRKLMKKVMRIAAKKNFKVGLTPIGTSRKFYERVGISFAK
ncbi:MAG: N-acetyltransferase [Bacteroidetes bacterium]|nr:MAG: N-acetyltransferase [Bacteroidota bacterium]